MTYTLLMVKAITFEKVMFVNYINLREHFNLFCCKFNN
jgi:hypothetical protein